MKSVNIAELKNRLSAYIQQVRAGEEFVICDRNLPVAKLVPLSATDTSAEELALVASGQLRLPERPLDEETFWALGVGASASETLARALDDVIGREREERDDSVLGR